MATNDGTIISDGQGHYKILKGNQWVDYSGPPPVAGGGRGRVGSGTSLSPQDQSFLNKLSDDAMKANETARVYDRAAGAVKEFGTGPYRGKLVGAMIPEDNGGVLDTIGSIVGVIPRALGAITPKDTSNYQYLRSLQQQNVLEGQTRQKGVQTEGDAARIMLSDISPLKEPDVNMQIIQQGKFKAQRAQAKAQFYNVWAKKFGLHGTNVKGATVDSAWSQLGDAYTKQLFHNQQPQPNAGDTIRVLSREKVGAK